MFRQKSVIKWKIIRSNGKFYSHSLLSSSSQSILKSNKKGASKTSNPKQKKIENEKDEDEGDLKSCSLFEKFV